MVPGGELVRALAAAGYGAIVVTDHYLPDTFESRETRDLFLRGYRAAKEAGKACGVTVLPGMEFRFAAADNDFLIYGMEEADFAELPDGLSRGSLADFSAYCRARGWLMYQAHPFRSWCSPQDPAYLDGVEVFNGNVRQLSHNPQALAFARENGLPELAGGDVHQLGDVRRLGMMVPQSLLTPGGIVEFLRTHPRVSAEFEEQIRE